MSLPAAAPAAAAAAPSGSAARKASSANRPREVYLITGSNTGVGYQTALQLALGDKTSCRHIVLACRTASKAQAAVERIQNAVPDGQVTYVEWVELDLADLSSIKRCVQEVTQTRKLPVKVLICNAGVNVAPTLAQPSFKVDGQFVANYLAHAILTKALLPTLEATAAESGTPSRVINVSSYMHRTAGKPDFAQACRVSNSKSYAVSKLCQIVQARAMFPVWKPRGVIFSVVHPGACASDIWKTFSSGLIREIAQSVAHTIFLSTAQGAASSVHAATRDLSTPESTESLEHFGPYPNPAAGWECLTDAWQPNFCTRVTKSETSVASRDPQLGEQLTKLTDDLEKEWEQAAAKADRQ